MSEVEEWRKAAELRYKRRQKQEIDTWFSRQKAKATRERNLQRMEDEGALPQEMHANNLYDPEMCGLVRDMAMDGKSRRKIAATLGVSVLTIAQWAKLHPDFYAALNPAEEMTNEVEMSVFKRAKGYKVKAQRPMSVQGAIEIAEFDEHIQPDMTAAKMWLQAHNPNKWSDKSMVAHEVGGLRDMLKKIGEEKSGLDAFADLGKAEALEPPKSE